MFHASCHWGAVELELGALPEALTDCNCSICRRYATLWGYFERDAVQVVGDPALRGRYFWGDAQIDFVHCARCGCVMYWEPRADVGQTNRVGINARMLDSILREGIPIRKLDGADTWEYQE